MAHNYVVTAQKPTAVSHALTANFTSADEMNLIVVKSTRMEIHQMTSDGLKPLLDVGIYGRVALILPFRPPKCKQDFLFICTENYEVCVLSFNAATGEIVTEAGGNVADHIGLPVSSGPIGMVDPDSKVVCLHLYTGLLRCIPVDENGSFKEAFGMRLEELLVLDITFLNGCSKPTIAVLYQDTKECRHIKTYEVNVKEKELMEGPWSLPNVEGGASKLIPVPKPLGGVIVVCEQTITYFNGPGTARSIATPATAIETFGKIDTDGSRYLLGDFQGLLYILFLKTQGGRLAEMKLERIGETSIPKALCYLDNGVVYVGSGLGDSQLIKLKEESDEAGNFVELLDSYPNLGPIVSFCVVDLDRQGQGQVVTCSGVGKEGSLRVIRNGVGVNELALLELTGVNGIWSLRKSETKFDHLLAISFVGETRFLAISGEEIEQTEIESLSSTEQTFFCGNVINGQIIQVAASGIRLINSETLQLNHSYVPPSGKKISVASCNGVQVLASTGGGQLVYLEVEGKSLVVKGETTFEHEISCLNAHPLDVNSPRATLAAVGLWTDISVRLIELPSLTQLHKHPLSGEIIPRSVLLASFEDIPYLLCGLGDGQLYSFALDTQTGGLKNQKKITLGTQPVLLNTFSSHNATHVFASCDRPTVIYSSNKKLLFSNVNLKEVNYITPLNAEAFPNSLAIATKEGVTLGTIDDIQKLHIRTLHLGETPRRIVHLNKSSVLAISVLSVLANGEAVGNIRLLDEQTFDVLDNFKLRQFEECSCLQAVIFSDDSNQYLVAGISTVIPTDDEPTVGRVVVFSISDGKTLKQVAEKEVKGGLTSLEAFNGKVLAAVSSKVLLLKLVDTDDGGKELVTECAHHGHVLALYLRSRGDFIIVGDMVKSISLLMYKPLDGIIEEIARDFNPNSMMAIEVLDDDVYLGADDSANLFTLTKNTEVPEDEHRRLDVVGQYHLGEYVNFFQRGSLVMKLPETELVNIDTILYCTAEGSVGVLASLPAAKYQLLNKMQINLTKIIKGVGGLLHGSWRSFANERKVVESRNFIDGDLIESFLDLPRDKMQQVVEGKHGGEPLEHTVEEMIKIVEELASLH